MKLARQVPVRHPLGSSRVRRAHVRVAGIAAVLALVAGAALAPVVAQVQVPTAAQRTQVTVRAFAFEAFPKWATTNHVEPCPAALADLVPFAGRDPVDTWGRPLELRCGDGYRGAYVRSAGPDGRFDTADDITSNDG